jgi:hypothetical protein
VLAVGSVFGLPHVVEGKLAQAVKGDALHEAGGDDAVGVDVIARHVNGAAGDLGDFC